MNNDKVHCENCGPDANRCNCPCHTPPESAINPEPNKDCKFCEGKLKYCPYHTSPPQEEPWVAELEGHIERCFSGEYGDTPDDSIAIFKSFIQKTLEADRKERAGVVLEKMKRMEFVEIDHSDIGSGNMWEGATSHARLGTSSAKLVNLTLSEVAEVIKDVMK